jgi:AAA family ATP:ADP antiporter
LGLQYPQKDIYFAYNALKGNRTDRRTSAIEFLDNLLQKDVKATILPLLEESSTETLLDRASRIFKLRAPSREESLRTLLQNNDTWLKACALYEVGEKRIAEFLDVCRLMTADRDPLIQETATWAVSRFS